jgi:hypothetical protein
MFSNHALGFESRKMFGWKVTFTQFPEPYSQGLFLHLIQMRARIWKGLVRIELRPMTLKRGKY